MRLKMKTKIRNTIIYIIVFIIIIASFIIPKILLQLQETNTEIEVYTGDKKEKQIDIEAEEIYLVKAIHEIEKSKNITTEYSNYKVEKVEDGIVSKNIFDEVDKLQEYNILPKTTGEKKLNQNIGIGIMNKHYTQEENKYIITTASIETEGCRYYLELEGKTGKAINVIIEKSNENLYQTMDKQQILKNYIKYLDLFIINDWEFKNNFMKSEKAKLIVSLAKSDEMYILSIHSSDMFSNINKKLN